MKIYPTLVNLKSIWVGNTKHVYETRSGCSGKTCFGVFKSHRFQIAETALHRTVT